MEEDRKNKDDAWKITHPRELCKKCWEWNESDNTAWNDMSGCIANIKEVYNDYLLGFTNECKYFIED